MRRSSTKYRKYFQNPIVNNLNNNPLSPNDPNYHLHQQVLSTFPVTESEKILNFFTIYNQSIQQNKTLLNHLEKLQMRIQTHIKIVYGKNDKQIINFRELCEKRQKGMELQPQQEKKKNKSSKKKAQNQENDKKNQRISKQQLDIMLREKQIHPYFQYKQKKRVFVVQQLVKCWMQLKAGYKVFVKFYYPAKYFDQDKYTQTFESILSIIYTRIEKFVLIFYGGDLHKDKLPNNESKKIHQALSRYKQTLDKDMLPVFEAVVKSIFDLYSLKNYRDRDFPNLDKKQILSLHYKLIIKFTSSAYKFSGRDIMANTSLDNTSNDIDSIDAFQKSMKKLKSNNEDEIDQYVGTRYYKYKFNNVDMSTPPIYTGDPLIRETLTITQAELKQSSSKQHFVTKVEWTFQLELHMLKLYLEYKKQNSVIEYLRLQIPQLAIHAQQTRPFILRYQSMNRRLIYELQKQFKARIKILQRDEINFREYKLITCSGNEKQVLLQRSTVNHLKLLMADYYINVTSKLNIFQNKQASIIEKIRQETKQVFTYNMEYLHSIIDVVYEMLQKKRNLAKVMPETDQDIASRYFINNQKLYKIKPNTDKLIQIIIKTPYYSSNTMSKDKDRSRKAKHGKNLSSSSIKLQESFDDLFPHQNELLPQQLTLRQFQQQGFSKGHIENYKNSQANTQNEANIKKQSSQNHGSTLTKIQQIQRYLPKQQFGPRTIQSTYQYRQSYNHFVQLRSSELPSGNSMSSEYSRQLLKKVLTYVDQKGSVSQFELEEQVVRDCLQVFLLFNGIVGVKDRMKQFYPDGRIKNDRQIRPFFAKIMSKALRFVQYHFIRSLEINKKTELSYNQMKFVTLKKQQKRALALHKGSHNVQLMLAQYYLMYTDPSITPKQQFEGNTLRYLVYIIQACLKILEYRQHLSGIILTEPELKKDTYPISLAYQFPYTVKSSEMQRRAFSTLLPDEVEGLKIDRQLKIVKQLYKTYPEQLNCHTDDEEASVIIFNLLTKLYEQQWKEDYKKHYELFHETFQAANKEAYNSDKNYREKQLPGNKRLVASINNQNPSFIKTQPKPLRVMEQINSNSVQQNNVQINSLNQKLTDQQKKSSLLKIQQQDKNNEVQKLPDDLKIIVDEDTCHSFLGEISSKLPKWGWPSNKNFKHNFQRRKFKHNQRVIEGQKTSVQLLDNSPSLLGLFQMLQTIGTSEMLKFNNQSTQETDVERQINDLGPIKKIKPNQIFDNSSQYIDNNKSFTIGQKMHQTKLLGDEFKGKNGVNLQAKKNKYMQVAMQMWKETSVKDPTRFTYKRQIDQNKINQDKWIEMIHKDWKQNGILLNDFIVSLSFNLSLF